MFFRGAREFAREHKTWGTFVVWEWGEKERKGLGKGYLLKGQNEDRKGSMKVMRENSQRNKNS
jgi:hypothetical protein